MDSIDDLHAAAQAALARNDRTEAARVFARLGATFPTDKMILLEAAQGLRACGNPAGAAALLETALTQAPRSLGLLDALAGATTAAGAGVAAADALERMARVLEDQVAAAPGDAASWTNLGRVRAKLGQWPAAAAALERAVALAPDDAATRAFLAETLTRAQTPTEALLDQASAADSKGVFTLARENYQTVLQRDPRHVYALSRLLTLDGFEGRLDDADIHHQALVDALEHADLANVGWEYLALAARQHAVRPLPQALYTRVTEALDRQLVAAMNPRPARAVTAQGRRLKIGYLSGLFRDNPVGHVTAALFAAHDRTRFDVHVFFCADITAPNPYTDTIRKGAEHFISLSGTPRAMADAVAAYDLDILIFIGGYTERALLQVVAARPAPVQVFWLGHAGNCDISAIDYFLADATVVPPGEERLYTAQVERLPWAYHCASPHKIGGPLTRAAAGLPPEGFVFCAFNNTEKIDRGVFQSWMNILKRVEGSVLWLSRGLSPAVEDNFRAAAAAAGVDGTRLVFAARLPDKAEHLARHRLCGLFLDTFLINAHTTALDALWSGLPLLTLQGNRFGARFGAMALRTLGLEDLIMPTPQAYEDRAVYFATHAAALEDVRGRLAASLYTAPLFQTGVFCRALEDSLERIHRAAAP